MPGNRQTRSNPLRSSARYNTNIDAALKESKKMANQEKKNALQEEFAFLRAAQESKELQEIQNSEALALQLQANENKQSRKAMDKQKNSNYKLAKKLQKGTSRKKTNAEIAMNLQLQFNKEAKNTLRENTLRSGPYEEEKESEPPPPFYVNHPVRLPRTRSKTISKPTSKPTSKPRSKSENTKKVKRWWRF